MRRLWSIVAGGSIGLWSSTALGLEEGRADPPTEPSPHVEPPRPVQPLTASYPESANGQHVVTLELVVGVAGDVTHASIVEGAEPYASAALEGAADWRFIPAVQRGKRLAARIRVQVQFVPPARASTEPSDLAALPTAPSPGVGPTTPPVEVTVSGEIVPARQSLGRVDTRQMPGAFGDPFRAIEALPGVTPIVSGLPYFFVRGAPPGNVGYFFDDVSIPLLFHGAAGPGVIHPAFVESVNLYPAAYPAKHGRYAGGIVEGELAQPEERLRGELSMRLLDVGGFAEVPFAERRGNLMLGGRYSYTGLLLSALSPNVNVGYWDYQALGSYAVTPSDELSVFAFGSHDYVAGDADSGRPVELLDLTFHRARVKYRKTLSPQTLLGVSAFGGVSRTAANDGRDHDQPSATDVIGQLVGARLTVEHQLDETFSLHVGADAYWSRTKVAPNLDPGVDPISDQDWRNAHDSTKLDAAAPVFVTRVPAPSLFDARTNRLPEAMFPPGSSGIIDFEDRSNTFVRDQFAPRRDVFSAIWVELGWRLTRNVSVKPALRFDSFLSGDTWTWAVDPRVTARYRLSETLAMVHTLGTAHQPPSFAVPIPGLSPQLTRQLQRAIQTSAGAELTLPQSSFASVTAYQNITLDSSDVLSLGRFAVASNQTDPFVDRTTAHAYGVEFLVRRSFTKSFGGLLAYTLSRSTRSVARANGISSFDRTHVISVAGARDLGRNWRFGGRLVTYSGIPASVGIVRALSAPPRTSWFYRVDWRLEKRWALGEGRGWFAFVAEVVNTTLNKEALNASCYAYGCVEDTFGPVTLPSLGIEASL